VSNKIAIRCVDVWKNYRIYHQRSHSLKERILTRRNSYEEFWALQDVSFEVPAGATLGIIGSNGSGKSSLLKVIARILTPNQGFVESTGTMSSLLELGTGFHPELTGRENVYLAGSLLGQRTRDIDRRYDSIVEFAGISDFMDLPVKNYSSGMYARLAFAVAISVEPEILLIDEVLSVGDEAFQMRCFERIAEFRQQGRTIVLVSHGMDNIRSLCSDAIWIDHGKAKAIGPSHEVVAQYLSEVHRTAEHLAGAAPPDRYGSMEAEIVDVKFEGPSGAAHGAAFRTGDPMTIRIKYRSDAAPLRDAACVVHVYRADNLLWVYGQSTKDAGLDLELQGAGEIEFAVDSLPLLKGTYVVTVSLQDDQGRRVFDCHDRRYSFLVFENTAMGLEYGAVHLDASWRFQSTPSSPSLAV
jgi:ABC-type polysaccharide/polyol phosphate transport system ATPase subunit